MSALRNSFTAVRAAEAWSMLSEKHEKALLHLYR
jgi:hypothetical protein